MAENQFFYGGQAVIEGVMIRGRSCYSLAVRRLDGRVDTLSEPLSQIFTGRLRKIPLVRGIIVLAETLALGLKALNRSATMAMEDQTGGTEEMPRWLMAASLTVAFIFGIGLFFILPLFASKGFEGQISSDLVNNLIEGLIRLVVLVAYVGAIGMLKDIKRVFAYHGRAHGSPHPRGRPSP